MKNFLCLSSKLLALLLRKAVGSYKILFNFVPLTDAHSPVLQKVV